MDPHKRSATIEVVDERGRIIDGGRFGTDKTGYVEMLDAGRRHPDRVWAVEGCNGIGSTSRTGSCVKVRDELVVMAMLVDRRDELGQTRTQTIKPSAQVAVGAFPRVGRRNSCRRTRPAR